MYNIAPTNYIPLSYQLPEGSASPTRYIQAKILRATTRALLSTVNLTNNGNGDFSNYTVTPLSLGLSEEDNFEVIITVYKDAGYTDSDDLRYATEKNLYQVRTPNAGAILGSAQVDYPKLIDVIVDKIFKFNQLSKIKDKKSFAQIVLKSLLSADQILKLNHESLESLELFDNKLTNISNNILDLTKVVLSESKQLLNSLILEMAKIEFPDMEKQEDKSREMIAEIKAELVKRISALQQVVSKIKIPELHTIEVALLEIKEQLNKPDYRGDYENLVRKLEKLELDLQLDYAHV